VGFFYAASISLAASATPALTRSKQEAEAKGYVFLSSHDEIVKLAKQEARVDGIVSLDPDTFAPLTKAAKIFIEDSLPAVKSSTSSAWPSRAFCRYRLR
jgi:hypothetical protein